jgi:hypothetical protein
MLHESERYENLFRTGSAGRLNGAAKKHGYDREDRQPETCLTEKAILSFSTVSGFHVLGFLPIYE